MDGRTAVPAFPLPITFPVALRPRFTHRVPSTHQLPVTLRPPSAHQLPVALRPPVAIRTLSASFSLLALLALLALPAGVSAQTGAAQAEPASGTASPAAAEAFGEEIMGQFEASARKIVALARTMPAETYGWEPMDGVASVAQAYMHIASYNYLYPETSLGVPAPDGLDYRSWEEDVTEKARVVELLEGSMDHVRAVVADMSGDDLAATTRLYGRDVPRWAVLLQLVAHMNEHLGQQIAYARSNGVVPPWSN